MELMFTLLAFAGLFGKLGIEFALKINLCKAQLKSCAMLALMQFWSGLYMEDMQELIADEVCLMLQAVSTSRSGSQVVLEMESLG
jgi:hypothetical protein